MTPTSIFISHSSKNREIAWQLAHDLQEEGFDVWLDRLEIEVGDEWPNKLEEGLDSSAVVLVIWTVDAAQSEWVRREIARADRNKKAIIPLIFDDTPVTLHLETLQHLDFREGYIRPFRALLSRLSVLIDDALQPTPRAQDAPWTFVTQASRRNEFLYENNYADIRNENFALNSQTQHLTHYDEPLASFVTYVAVPLPNPIAVDFDQVEALVPERADPSGIGEIVDGQQELWFMTGHLPQRRSEHDDYLLYEYYPGRKAGWPPPTRQHLRFTRSGAVEWATTMFSGTATNQEQVIHFFKLIPILGGAWKFVHMAANYFSKFNYLGEFQLLVNLRNTANADLLLFAPNWPDLANRYSIHLSVRTDYPGWAKSTNSHLQYVFNIDVSALLRSPTVSRDLMIKLSRELQRSFNLKPEDRHYTQNTSEFPWEMYHKHLYTR